eukprot:COSAG02_NODE_19525_length_877_cov_31.652956_1_plen_91_part_10
MVRCEAVGSGLGVLQVGVVGHAGVNEEMFARRLHRAPAGVKARAASAIAASAAARRVPQHLTMTLEELLATSDKSSTHRMVEQRTGTHVQA